MTNLSIQNKIVKLLDKTIPPIIRIVQLVSLTIIVSSVFWNIRYTTYAFYVLGLFNIIGNMQLLSRNVNSSPFISSLNTLLIMYSKYNATYPLTHLFVMVSVHRFFRDPFET